MKYHFKYRSDKMVMLFKVLIIISLIIPLLLIVPELVVEQFQYLEVMLK